MDTRTDGPVEPAPRRVEPGPSSPDRSPVRGTVAVRPVTASPGFPPAAGTGRPPHPATDPTGPEQALRPALRPTLRMLAAAGYDLDVLAAEGRALQARLTRRTAGTVTALRPAAGAER